MVGGFPIRRKKKIYGGQVFACMRLFESSFVSTHAVRTIDTTQLSNPPPPFLLRMFLAIKRLITFSLDLSLRRPDVVIIFLADGASVYEKGLMARLSRALRIPVMVFPRAGSLIPSYFASRLHAAIVRSTLGQADMFLCQGVTFQKFAVNELKFEEKRAPIIPNWTATSDHIHIGKTRRYDQKITCVRILFLGWVEDFKGVFELLEATLILQKSGISFHLTFGGDGSVLKDAKSFVEQHSLQSKITFAGWVDGDDKNSLLSSNDIFVLPSWSEGLPNSMIEAMSAGLACVVTDVGMITDYLVDRRDALIVQPRDVTGLAAALKSLILNCSRRETIARNGYTLASSQFSLENGVKLISDAVFFAKDCCDH